MLSCVFTIDVIAQVAWNTIVRWVCCKKEQKILVEDEIALKVVNLDCSLNIRKS